MPVTAFFLDSARGQRFCLLHSPVDGAPVRGAVLYLHPFAEEMNKSRRMAALMARRLAGAGYVVLQIDLAGCGDSSGDFADADWDDWLQDAQDGIEWLRGLYGCEPILWGLRLGGLLAAEAAVRAGLSRLLLWQPVLNGEQFLTQFLRLRLAADMLSAGGAAGSTSNLRSQLRSGDALEIAGYMLSPKLALAIDCRKMADLLTADVRVDWLELLPAADRPISPVIGKLIETWRQSGRQVNLMPLAGAQFWATQEISDVPQLIDASLQLLEAGHA